MSNFVLVRSFCRGLVARHLRPWLPSSVVAIVFCLVHIVSSWFRKRSSFFVFAPVMKVRCLAFGARFLARNSSGVVPVPPAAIRILPWCSVKWFPNGPRMPIVSPFLRLCSACVALPTALTATVVLLLLVFSMLRGISSMVGIQSIRNWPGLAFAQSLSFRVKVFIVGVSVVMFRIGVVRMVLVAV